jgi:hypothetical protein
VVNVFVAVMLDVASEGESRIMDAAFRSIRNSSTTKPYLVCIPSEKCTMKADQLLAIDPSGHVLFTILKGLAVDQQLHDWDSDVITVVLGHELVQQRGEFLVPEIHQKYPNSTLYIERPDCGLEIVARIPGIPELSSKPLKEAGMSTRTENLLRRRGFETYGDIAIHTEHYFLSSEMPGFGRHSLEEVKDALAAVGLTLREP